MDFDRVIAELRRRNVSVPRPARLPSADEVAEVERELGIAFPSEFRRYVLEAGDVSLGVYEPVTITNPIAHTHLATVLADARAMGVPRDWLPFCENNSDYFCFDSTGAVRYWSHDGPSTERWAGFADWVTDVWLS